MNPYHAGELAVQQKAGVQDMASRIGQSIRSDIPETAATFLSQQRFVILGSVDAQGQVWASLLRGRPGFLSVPDENTLHIVSSTTAGDPLMCNIRGQCTAGLIAIDFSTRQRMRINGSAKRIQEGIQISAEQVYSNCKKYIQARRLDSASDAPLVHAEESFRPSEPRPFSTLSETQTASINTADTFFIASHHQNRGVDVSHRGGAPGFVRMLDNHTLIWPDYAGNTMFQTLGNLQTNPAAGLLFINFKTGSRLMLTGQAKILWDSPHMKTMPGAERCVHFSLKSGIEVRDTAPQRWTFENYSSFNPELAKQI